MPSLSIPSTYLPAEIILIDFPCIFAINWPHENRSRHVVKTMTESTKIAVPTVYDILRGSAHALTIFKPGTAENLEIYLKRGKPYLICFASGKERPAKPEEIVRQLYIDMLMEDYGYPAERIYVERPVQFGSAVHEKAADIFICDKDDPNTAFIIVECKKPKRSEGLEQTATIPLGVVVLFR